MTASRIIGSYMGDLVGEDIEGEDELAALVGDLELGRRMRRGQRRRAGRAMSRLGVTPEQLAQARASSNAAQLQATNIQALTENAQLTAGHYVADGGQRTLYLPFSAPAAMLAAAGSPARLQATVQRPMSVKRVIIAAVDNATLAGALPSIGVTNISIGVQPVFNANGITPAEAFAFNAVGNNLETMVARVGVQITIDLQRLVLAPNASTITGYLIGVSAEH